MIGFTHFLELKKMKIQLPWSSKFEGWLSKLTSIVKLPLKPCLP